MKFTELVNQQTERYYRRVLGEDVSKEKVQEFEQAVKFLGRLMTTDGSNHELPRLKMEEALGSTDASILFPRVISDVLVRPKEPMLFLQNEIAKVVSVDTVNYIEFPTLGALRAFDVPEMGEYPEQSLSFTQHMTSVRVGKAGLAISLSDEILKDSMWDVMALYVEAAGFAMRRFKEEKLVKALQDKGRVIFDNDQNFTTTTVPSAFWTNGKAYNGSTRNYSITFDDHINLLASLAQQDYIPTHILIHPMAWSIWATDPLLRSQFMMAGQMGVTNWADTPGNFDQGMRFPWNLQYRVTPFMPFNYSKVVGGAGSALGPANCTDVCVLDGNNSLIVLQREAPSSEEFRDVRRDVQSMKIKERYGVAALNAGRGIVWARNIRLVQNYEAYNRVVQVTP